MKYDLYNVVLKPKHLTQVVAVKIISLNLQPV